MGALRSRQLALISCALVSGIASANAQAAPKLTIACHDDNHCVALETHNQVDRADVVIASAIRPALRFEGKDLLVEPCDDDPSRWCAADVPTRNLTLQVGEITQVLAGSKIVVLLAPTAFALERDPFDDVVLVGGPRGYRCSGVLVDRLHVLTAAHCAPATHIGSGTNATNARRINVSSSVIHPVLDVAVLRLEQHLGAVVHARRALGQSQAPVGRVRILGFGARGLLRFVGFGSRRQVDLFLDGWGCQPLHSGSLGCRSGLEMHVRDATGNDTCFGDSGGPVFEETTDGWRLVAITSRGAQPRRVLCGEGGIYVRVDQFASWLQGVLS